MGAEMAAGMAPEIDSASLLQAAKDLLGREAAYLDERRWDDWLSLFHRDCEFWVPSWRDDGTLVENPKREISLFYHANRSGLEDRVFRLTSNQSPASMPLARTAHLVSNVQLAGPVSDATVAVTSTWVSHVYDPKHGETHCFFGRSHHTLARDGAGWLITRKKVTLLNDRIGSTLDFYCV